MRARRLEDVAEPAIATPPARFSFAPALVAIAGCLALVIAASANAGATWRYDLFNDVMSPYCPGRSLNDCPSSQAAELRAWISLQEDGGRSRAQVEADLYEIYGELILSAPKPEGWGLTAYVVPVVAFLVAGVVLVVFLRRHAGAPLAPDAAGGPVTPVDPELERLVDHELGS